MKRNFLFGAALLAAVAFSSSAQAQGIRLGFKGGANYSNLAGDLANENRFQNKWGGHGGLMVNIGLLDDGFLSVQPEVLYSQKGFNYDEKEVFGLVRNKGSLTYNYIDVPVLFKINADGFFFEAGPQYSYLLKVKDDSEQSLTGTGLYTKSSGTFDLSNVNRNEIGYAAGLGYQSTAGFLVGIRYNGSFTDFGKDGYQNEELRNARNSVFQASLGYLIPSK